MVNDVLFIVIITFPKNHQRKLNDQSAGEVSISEAILNVYFEYTINQYLKAKSTTSVFI